MTTENGHEVFNGVEIRFDGTLINLTNMWRAAGANRHHDPYSWVRLDETSQLLEYIEKSPKYGSGPYLETRRGRYGGTFAHWQIALAYAKYLSPKIHTWCNEIVKERYEEEADPELGIKRAHDRFVNHYRKMGKSPA